MLSAREIADLLSVRAGTRDALSVVPTPDLGELRARGGTSIDLRLGRWFRTFKQTHITSVPLVSFPSDGEDIAERSRTREYFVPFDGTYVLHPGRFVLGATLEWICLPTALSGYVTGKTALARHGLVIETAAGIHPGFSGCLTLELANVGEVPLALYPGMEICQIFLHRTSNQSVASRGNFSSHRKPTVSPPKVDPMLTRIRSRPAADQ